VCLESYCTEGELTETWPFVCGHSTCIGCDRQMYIRHDDRCPCCRSARRVDLPAPGWRSPFPPDNEFPSGARTVSFMFFPLEAPVHARDGGGAGGRLFDRPNDAVRSVVATIGDGVGEDGGNGGSSSSRGGRSGRGVAEDGGPFERGWGYDATLAHLLDPGVQQLLQELVDPTMGSLQDRAERRRDRQLHIRRM
jgi:hypothetical protein